MNVPEVEYDPELNVSYVRFRERSTRITTYLVGHGICVDYDALGPVGVEVHHGDV